MIDILFSFVFRVINFLFPENLLSHSRHEDKDKEYEGKVRKCFPGPAPLSWIGALLQYAYIKLKFGSLPPHERAHALCQTYGKTCSLRAGGLPVLFTEDFEVAKEILHSPDFSARFASHLRFHELTFNKNVGLLTAKEEPWKTMRKYTIRTLKQYEFGEVRSAEELIDKELGHFFYKLDQDCTKNSNVIDVHNYFQMFVINCMRQMLSGERLDYSDPKISTLVEDIERATYTGIDYFNVDSIFPILRHIPGFSIFQHHREAMKHMQNFFVKFMYKRRSEYSYMKDPAENFVDHFLQKQDKEQSKNSHGIQFTNDQFIQICCDLLCGSVDNVSSTIQVAVLNLLQNPNVLEKVHTEINKVVGHDDLPAWHHDSKRMPYMQAVMLEALRHANVNPLIGRSNTVDTMVDGYVVPGGTQVGINLAFIHMDPEVWGDPDNFRPERFLDEQMNIINEDKILAFGGGTRACIGSSMTKVIIFKIVTGLLRRYNIASSPEHPQLNSEMTNGTAPFYCMLSYRK